MNFKFSLASALLALASTPVFAHQVKCLSDHRAVDGDMIQFVLSVDAKNQAVLTVNKEVASRIGSHSEKSVIHHLNCTFKDDAKVEVECGGFYTFSVKAEPHKNERVESVRATLAGPWGFSRTFKNFPIGTGAVKDGCEVKAD